MNRQRLGREKLLAGAVAALCVTVAVAPAVAFRGGGGFHGGFADGGADYGGELIQCE